MTDTDIADLVKAECEKQFSPIEFIECSSTGGCSGAKIELTIVSETFSNVPLIQRHRKVQTVLKNAGYGMDVIHALTIKAWTVEQWEKKKNQA